MKLKQTAVPIKSSPSPKSMKVVQMEPDYEQNGHSV